MSKYGFTAVPIDAELHLKGRPYIHKPAVYTVAELAVRATAESEAIEAYARKHLGEPTFNHSMRVYLYGAAILRDQFPEWTLDPAVYFASCLLHDIGTTVDNTKASKMSFEFYGGLLARDLVLATTHDAEYADAVCEAIIRHQDLGTVGNITQLGFLLQLTTILDNAGKNTGVVAEETITAINEAYPRHSWLSCFAKVIDAEYAAKPWCHTSALGIDNFKNLVLSNEYMKRYE